MDTYGIDLDLLKRQLMGSNLKKLLTKKKLSKWRLAKDTGITYHTVLNWQKEFCRPSDENAIKAGRYLGLLKLSEAERFKLKEEIEILKIKLDRLEG